jgi:hypothetical protein
VRIIGAGMAGLLAGAMLRNELHEIIEERPKLPNNHSAVLRFRSSVVGDVLNIPFRKVRVLKASQTWMNPVADALWYSFKTNGTMTLRSSVSGSGEIVERYIAPENLVERMSDLIPIARMAFGEKWKPTTFRASPTISTMPMPALMKALGWRDAPSFQFQPGRNVSFTLPNMDAYCSLYVPNPRLIPARVSITKNRVIAECPPSPASIEDIIAQTCQLLGYANLTVTDYEDRASLYQKILPIDEDVRKSFIVWATRQHNIYSLGRFATWRPGLLMDDVVHDVRVIQRLALGGSDYDSIKK